MSHVVAGRYRLVREIGRGGMGAVWLAHDTRLDRQVALKQVGLVPGSEVADLERVRREAQVAAMLSHPNVVAVFDLVDEGSRHWLVMEYVDGQTLAELAAHRPLQPDTLAGIVAQAARALAVAHRAGVVHRDVKPSNILVTPAGVAKLGDFGIARADTDHTLTQTGLVTGSPAYLAPEVASGSPATPASDLWSLGATVFQGLTGRPPYDTSGGHLMAALYRLVNEEPPRTDRAGWLAPALEATMHRDPGGRWSAEQVAEFLERGPTGGPAPAPVPDATRVLPPAPAGPAPAGPPAPAVPPWRRFNPALAVLAALVLAGVVVAAVLAATGGDGAPTGSGIGEPSRPASSATSAPTSKATTAAATAEGMEKFVREYLSAAVNDTRRAYDTMLTPAFQRESGGFEGYSGFWSTIESAELRQVRPDPASLTVGYDVVYRLRGGGGGEGGDGEGGGEGKDEGKDKDEEKGDKDEGGEAGRVEDSVTLVLAWDGSSYRIASER